jgi:2-amino-4-hydroxy-6-hydroxymethyldihydropteridine diphosphokinase
MEYSRWAPYYDAIAREFGFPFDREERSAARLEALLPPPAKEDPLGRIGRRLADRDVVVVGLAPRAGPPPIWRLPSAGPTPAVVAADGAAATCLDAGIVPAVIATDLDGPLATEVGANRRGSLVVVHAHGDNEPAVEEWVPQFPGELAGSWAGPPRPALVDVGGFTDGDRAVFLAEAAGARTILLWGFDFRLSDEPGPESRRLKLAKLAWAERLIGVLAETGRSRIETWRRDGSRVPYVAGKYAASTR